MTSVSNYLVTFRKVGSLEKLEQLFDHLNYTINSNLELINMYRAADHRRAEIISGGKLYDPGCIPQTIWHYVE